MEKKIQGLCGFRVDTLARTASLAISGTVCTVANACMALLGWRLVMGKLACLRLACIRYFGSWGA